MRFLFLLTLFACCLSACVNQSYNKPIGGTFSTIQSPGLTFPSGTSFSWSPGMTQTNSGSGLENVDIDGMLRNSIQEELTLRSYRVVAGGQYIISYIAALEQVLSDDEIDRRFGINPGLPGQQKTGQSYEKGTIIIDVSDPASQKSLWRSAMQGYVEPDLPHKVRSERVQRIVAMMFRSFPRGK